MVTAWVLRLDERLPIISTAVRDASKRKAMRLPARVTLPDVLVLRSVVECRGIHGR